MGNYEAKIYLRTYIELLSDIYKRSMYYLLLINSTLLTIILRPIKRSPYDINSSFGSVLVLPSVWYATESFPQFSCKISFAWIIFSEGRHQRPLRDAKK
jgi:hypothetical protein